MKKQMMKIDSSSGDICLLTVGTRHIVNLFIQDLLELYLEFWHLRLKTDKILMAQKHYFRGCVCSYEFICNISLNKRIWKNMMMLCTRFQRLRIDIILISVIPRCSIHEPKPNINSSRLIAFVIPVLSLPIVWFITHSEPHYSYRWNGDRLETDRLGFISWLRDLIHVISE